MSNLLSISRRGRLLRLLLVLGGLRLLDEGHHIAHAEDPAGHPVRVKDLEVVQLFADADEFDRLAGDRAHTQRRAAAGVAVQLGEHHPVNADLFIEAGGDIDRVLTDHRVDDQQRLVHRHGLL